MKTETKIKKRIKKGLRQVIGLEKKPPKRNGFSDTTKSTIRRFQKGRCEVYGCKETKWLDFDHIRGRTDNSIENCQLLCKNHHAYKTRRDNIRRRLARDLKNV